HKDHQSPWQIIERLAPRSPLELCLLPPVFLDYYLNNSGGYDVPRQPWKCPPRSIVQRRSDFPAAFFGFSAQPIPNSLQGALKLLHWRRFQQIKGSFQLCLSTQIHNLRNQSIRLF
ncbi:MAG TPA: hypothetical protein VGR97_11310, partial [Candidatus Acidoferrales bacterium]|nr:hypothetical protein [Candidatus Acidoferrales bacterium]